MTGELAPGTRVKLAPVELEVLDVEASRTDDELVSASLRGSLADLALGAVLVSANARAASRGAGAAAEKLESGAPEAAGAARHLERSANAVSDAAGQVAKVAALAAVVGSLAASNEERSEVRLRAVVEDRVYRATCASSDKRTMLDPDGRPSLSCAIVSVIDEPKRHWTLAIRTPGGALDAKRLNGSLEARTAHARDDTLPIFRIRSSDSARAGSGYETSKTLHNAFVEIDTLSGHIASIELSDGLSSNAWIDTSSLLETEARDVVVAASAIISAFRWRGLRWEN